MYPFGYHKARSPGLVWAVATIPNRDPVLRFCSAVLRGVAPLSKHPHFQLKKPRDSRALQESMRPVSPDFVWARASVPFRDPVLRDCVAALRGFAPAPEEG